MLDPFASATETIHPLGQLRLGDQEGRASRLSAPGGGTIRRPPCASWVLLGFSGMVLAIAWGRPSS